MPVEQAKVSALQGRNCPAIHTMKLNPRPEQLHIFESQMRVEQKCPNRQKMGESYRRIARKEAFTQYSISINSHRCLKSNVGITSIT